MKNCIIYFIKLCISTWTGEGRRSLLIYCPPPQAQGGLLVKGLKGVSMQLNVFLSRVRARPPMSRCRRQVKAGPPSRRPAGTSWSSNPTPPSSTSSTPWGYSTKAYSGEGGGGLTDCPATEFRYEDEESDKRGENREGKFLGKFRWRWT